MYCSFTLKGTNYSYIDGLTPPNLPLTSGFGGYYSTHFITIHTGTTSGFATNSGNCVAATWGWYDKQIILQGPNGPASSAYQQPYFRFNIRTLCATAETIVEVHTTTATSAYTVVYSISDTKAMPSSVRCITSGVYNAVYEKFADSSITSSSFYGWRDNSFNRMTPFTDQRYITNNSIFAANHGFYRYNFTGVPNTFEIVSLYPKNVFYLWQRTSTTMGIYRNDTYVMTANTYYNGTVSSNTYTAGAKTYTFFWPSTGTSITKSNYSFYLSLSGFQRWRKLEMLYEYLVSSSTEVSIVHQGMFTFGTRGYTTGITSSTSFLISKTNFYVPNTATGKTAYLTVYIRKNTELADNQWEAWKQATALTVTSIGDTYANSPTIPINFTESSLTKQFRIGITITNCPSSIPTGRRRYTYTANIQLIRMSADTSSTEYQTTSFTMSTTHGLSENQTTQSFLYNKGVTVLERYLRSQTAKLVSIVVKNETSSSTRTFSYGLSNGLTFDENSVDYAVTMSYTSLPA